MLAPRTLSLFASLMAFVLLATPVAAQFGVPKKAKDIPDQMQAEINNDGKEKFLSAQDAADMDELIRKAKADPETMQMITKMRIEMKDELAALGKEPIEEIIGGMKQALDEIKMLDYLFKDKERALRELDKEGLIDKDHLEKYKDDPDLLEQDTRKGLYFSFVSLAAVAGFI